MGLVHENLYKSQNLSQLDLKSYFNDLMDQIRRAYSGSEKAIELSADIAPLPLDIDTVIACGLIVNELLTQSFKNATNGSINVDLTLGLDSSGHYKLRYEDSSEGLTGGLTIEKGDSMIILQTLVNQLAGDLKISPSQSVIEISWFNPEYLELL